MPPGWGGGTGGRGGGDGGASRRVAGGRGGGAKDLQGRDEIRKFLNFYKRRNSVCVDLYQSAFYSKKPNWEELADFVFSVVAVGGTSSPELIRAAVMDIQLHPVKKLLFLKFTDQQIRDEVAARLHAGLLWPAFDTTVTGWGMDKPVERIRVLGASPETDEAGVKLVLGEYGEVLDARKGLISSKKLPGCTNGIWTVRLIMEQGKTLPPFLIIKEEGEVWQLATGEISVCWQCGLQGHIGDKCHQDVSALASSLTGPALSKQPSWAHVVRGAQAGHFLPPPLNVEVGLRGDGQAVGRVDGRGLAVVDQAASRVLGCTEAGSKEQEKVDENISVQGRAALDEDYEIVVSVEENESMEVQTSLEIKRNKQKKRKFVDESSGSESESEEIQSGSFDSHATSKAGLKSQTTLVSQQLKVIVPDEILDSSVDSSPRCHKGGKGMRQVDGKVIGEKVDYGTGLEAQRSQSTSRSRLFNYKWFDVAIEDGTEKGGGRIIFSDYEKNFADNVDDYFILMKDKCTLGHKCAGRVKMVREDMIDRVIAPPDTDLRDIPYILSLVGDGCVIDTGWKVVTND